MVGRPADAGRCGHVREVTADVSEQVIGADRGDEQVDPAVVVVVGGGDAHPVQVDGETGGGRYVGKSPVAVVAVQLEVTK